MNKNETAFFISFDVSKINFVCSHETADAKKDPMRYPLHRLPAPSMPNTLKLSAFPAANTRAKNPTN
ncbi:MAG: hypothetical protein HY579_00115 [Nitrospinae bacterium]|nr:hypothetical protein [Nitrospinota bacterium]